MDAEAATLTTAGSDGDGRAGEKINGGWDEHELEDEGRMRDGEKDGGRGRE